MSLPKGSVSLDSNSTKFIEWRRLQLCRAKLKGVTEMAALMAGFSVVATVELDISKSVSPNLLVAFSVTTALLVSTTMLSIMIVTCVLPHIDAIAKLNTYSLMKESPHDTLARYIDFAWFLANTASIFLFILDVVLLSWIKFHKTEAICVTAIMIPVLISLCLFSVVFYREVVTHQIEIFDKRYQELQAFSIRLDDKTENFDNEVVLKTNSSSSDNSVGKGSVLTV